MTSYDERKSEEESRLAAIVAIGSTVAQQLTTVTGRPWGSDPQSDEYANAVVGWTDGRLHVYASRPSYGDEPSKITLSGRLPAGFEIGRISTYKLDRPNDIRVALARGPVVIAKEIARRLLPAWDVYQTECYRRLAEADAYRDGKQGLANRLIVASANALADRQPSWRQQSGDGPGLLRTSYQHPSGLDVEVELHGTDEATLKVRASGEKIEVLLRQMFPPPVPEMPAGDIIAKHGAGARLLPPRPASVPDAVQFLDELNRPTPGLQEAQQQIVDAMAAPIMDRLQTIYALTGRDSHGR